MKDENRVPLRISGGVASILIVALGGVQFYPQLGFDIEWRMWLGPVVYGFATAWLYGVTCNPDPRHVIARTMKSWFAPWSALLMFLVLLQVISGPVVFLGIFMIPFLLVPLIVGAFLGSLMYRNSRGWLDSLGILCALCSLPPTIYYLVAAVRAESRWTIQLATLGTVTLCLLCSDWLRHALPAPGRRVLATFRTLGLMIALITLFMLYSGPAREIRFWVFPATAVVTNDRPRGPVIYFTFDEFPRERFTLYPSDTQDFDEYARTLNNTKVDITLFRELRFGLSTHGPAGFIVESIGDPKMNFQHLCSATTVDGKVLTLDRSISKEEAERVLGREIDHPFAK